MPQERVLISSAWGKVTAELVDNSATRALVRMLPLTIEMRDHLRQEKTGTLPSALPVVARRLDFSTGTLGLWSANHFVIYYRTGRVPEPGIIPLGQTLIVTSGLGWVQREGGPVEEVRPGDVVWFPPGLKHWHGATATTAMTHIAIQEQLDGRAVDWMEHVTDEQYRASPARR